MRLPLTIIKIGGNVINSPAALYETLDYFASLVEPAILVHGGGRKASEILTEMGRQPMMVGGRRITDAATLEIVTMVYAGLINKNVVAGLQARGTNAIGLSGADAGAVLAEKRAVPEGGTDYGFAGDVLGVNATLLDEFLRLGLRPVLCPITHDAKGQLLNTNADTIAAETAKAMAGQGYTVRLKYCFELPGVMRDVTDRESVINQITPGSYKDLKAQGIIHGGMLPKLDNAFAAIAAGVHEVVVADLKNIRDGEGTTLLAG